MVHDDDDADADADVVVVVDGDDDDYVPSFADCQIRWLTVDVDVDVDDVELVVIVDNGSSTMLNSRNIVLVIGRLWYKPMQYKDLLGCNIHTVEHR